MDIQDIWLDRSPGLKASLEKRAKVINEAIAWFRKRGLPIIVVYHVDKGRGPFPGTKPFEVFDQIAVAETDIKVVKNYPNSFGQTGLADLLKKNGCDSIVLVGLSADWCVMATFFGAMDWDITPYALEGGIAASTEEHVHFAEEVCDMTTLQKLEDAVRE